jgi:LAO/AO transport system kinase
MTVESGSLAGRLLARDPRAIARAISVVENESSEAAALVSRIYPHTGRAYLIGLTGPPGAGKSTLADRLVSAFRKTGATIGVLAVDPTSPYTGGAILGDRVRMQMHAEDEGVFIRSMATRGHLGGLARTTAEAAIVLDAAGFDLVIIETVGVGQDEVDVVRMADVSVVTAVPGTGDDVQALKAGVMEIADIFVVNKADREGADRTAASIDAMLSLQSWPGDGWKPPVLRTEATTGRGVADLVQAIEQFQAATRDRLHERRRVNAEWRVREILSRQFLQGLEQRVLAPGEFAHLLDRVARRDIDPYSAAASALSRALDDERDPRRGSEVTLRHAASDAVREGHLVAAIDHIGVAVQDARELVEMFSRVFGLETGVPERVGVHRVRFVETGDATVELVEPLALDAPVAKFLQKRGSGLHHVCFRVPDIDAAIAALKAGGATFIDDAARPGAHGSRIAFLHPSSTCGLLIELKQPSSE